MDDATGKILRAEACLLGDYAYRNIIIEDAWILEAFKNPRPADHAGYLRLPQATKLQLQPFGADDLDDDAKNADKALLVDVTKVPSSDAYARRHFEDKDKWSIAKSGAQQQLEAWWNNSVNRPELKRKKDVSGANNIDQVNTASVSKRMRTDSQSFERQPKRVLLDSTSLPQHTEPMAPQTRDSAAHNQSEVIDTNGEPEGDIPLRVVVVLKDIGQPGREGSKALPNQSLGKKPDGGAVLTISEGVPAVAQSALSAPSGSQLAAIASIDSRNADPISNRRALRVQKNRLRDFNDSLVASLLQKTDSESEQVQVLPTAHSSEAVESSHRKKGVNPVTKTDGAPAVTQPVPSASAHPAATITQTMSAANAETTALDNFYASIKPKHQWNNRNKCKTCRCTPSLPWLPSSGNGREMARILIHMNENASLAQKQQLEFVHMFNVVRVDVTKMKKVFKGAFHGRLQAFVVRYGILEEYNKFAALQHREAKTRYYRLPVFKPEYGSRG